MGFKKSQNTIIIAFFVFVSAISRVSSSVAIDSIKLDSDKEGSRSLYAVDTIYDDCDSMLFSPMTGADYYFNIASCSFTNPNFYAICPTTKEDLINILDCASSLGQNGTYWTTFIGGGGPNQDSFVCPPGSANEGTPIDLSMVGPRPFPCDPRDSNCGLVFGTSLDRTELSPTALSDSNYSPVCYNNQ